MKVIVFSLALISATSLISSPADDVRRVVETRAGCPICPRCEICGKEIHDEEDENIDAATAQEQAQESSDVKCGCGGVKPPRPSR